MMILRPPVSEYKPPPFFPSSSPKSSSTLLLPTYLHTAEISSQKYRQNPSTWITLSAEESVLRM